MSLFPETSRVLKEVVLIALLGMGGKLDERPSHKPDAVLPALGPLRRAIPHAALQSLVSDRLALIPDKTSSLTAS